MRTLFAAALSLSFAAQAYAQDAALSEMPISQAGSVLDVDPAAYTIEEMGLEFLDIATADSFAPLTNTVSFAVQDIRVSNNTYSSSFQLRFREMDKRDEGASNTWFIFAGSDSEALTLMNGKTSAMQLRQHVGQGDIHVGVAFPMLNGHTSLGISQRTIEYTDLQNTYSMDDHVVGISFGARF